MSGIPKYVARKIEQEVASRSAKRLGGHLSFTNLLIGAEFAGLGYVGGLAIAGISTGSSVVSYLLTGDLHGAQEALLKSDAYRIAGEFALAGYATGSILANKIKGYIRGFLK